MTPTTINKYQIIEKLGEGNFGEVYRVFDRAIGSQKAIKVLNVGDPSEFKAKLEEAQILNKCRHKHIVKINEANIFEVAGVPRIILDLEFIPGGSLEDAIERRWVSIRDSVNYVRGALIGLEHAHNSGFLHRDIKPGNILISNNYALLSDFGLATDVGAGLAGSARGYRTHLPPEYFSTRQTSPSSDVFAAGVTLFRSVSNIKNWREMVRATANWPRLVESGTLVKKFGYLEFVPGRLRRIINKACNADPAKRFRTASEFREQLDQLRWGIDWIRINEYAWKGHDPKWDYDLEVDCKKLLVEYRKNGRRVGCKCTKHKSLGEAIQKMNVEVAESVFMAS